LRNLDKENPAIVRPQQTALIGALLPFLLGGMCAVIASEATPRLPWGSTPLPIFCLSLCPAALVAAILPRIFNWDWRAQYFGFGTLCLSSVSLLGIVPWLCLLLYSSLGVWEKLLLLAWYLAPMTWWCYRFLIYYRKIFLDTATRDLVYVEENDAVYYYQRNDNWLIEKRYKFKLFPSASLFIVPLALALLSAPWAHLVRAHVGLPFVYTFLTVASLPLVMTFLGLTMKCYLVFFHYPRRIKIATGKNVYVDMVSRTARFGKI
jgi:hypothetical protein